MSLHFANIRIQFYGKTDFRTANYSALCAEMAIDIEALKMLDLSSCLDGRSRDECNQRSSDGKTTWFRNV